jgi:hypothetical protein
MYFINGFIFHTEKYDEGRKSCNIGVCVKGSTSDEFEGKLE